MNREEAIKEAETQIDVYESMILYNKDFEPRNDNSNYEKKLDFLKIAIEALEKQQTTKYKHLGTRHTHWGKCRHDKFRCETCGFTKEFTNNHTAQYKYCPSCGRKIDWSKPKGDSYDFAIIDEVIAYDTQKKD